MSILDSDVTIEKDISEIAAISEMCKRVLGNKLSDEQQAALVNQIINNFNFLMKMHRVNQRSASYDFCYLYFQKNKGDLGGKNMERSCMQLWSYLASWGMLRGSSTLLQCSPAVLKELIKHFDSISSSPIWDADVDTYNSNIDIIMDEYKTISSILKNNMHNAPSDTLVTKIMLGVFGCVPAFDTFFKRAFRVINPKFKTMGKNELNDIADFYKKQKSIIDAIKIPVIDFDGNPTKVCYKKAKLIDMFGFYVGQHVQL